MPDPNDNSQQSQSVSIPFLSPTTGKVQNVPQENWEELLGAGYKPTQHIVTYGPAGERAMVPKTGMREYTDQGYQTTPETQFESERRPENQPGFLSHVGSAALGLLKGVGSGGSFMPGANAGNIVRSAAQTGLDTAARQQEGRSKAYQIAAPLAQALVPGLNPRAMEEAANTGDRAGVLGEAAVPAALATAPSVLKAGRDTIRNIGTPAIPPGLSPEATANLQNPAVRQSLFKIQRGLTPSAANNDFLEKAAIAAPDMAAMDRVNPIKGAVDANGTPIRGGIIRPDQRLRLVDTNLENAQNQLITNERDPIIQKYNNVGATTRDVLFQGMKPDEVAAFENQFGRVPDQMNVGTADRLRADVNDFLRKAKLNQVTPEARNLKTSTDQNLQNLDDIKNHLQGAVEDAVAPYGGQSLNDINRRYAGLQEMQDATRGRINTAEAARMGDQAIRGGPGMGINLLERLHIKPSPGRLVQQGLTGLNESGIAPAPRLNQPSGPAPTVPAAGFNRSQPFEDATVYEDRPGPNTPKQLPYSNMPDTLTQPALPPTKPGSPLYSETNYGAAESRAPINDETQVRAQGNTASPRPLGSQVPFGDTQPGRAPITPDLPPADIRWPLTKPPIPQVPGGPGQNAAMFPNESPWWSGSVHQAPITTPLWEPAPSTPPSSIPMTYPSSPSHPDAALPPPTLPAVPSDVGTPPPTPTGGYAPVTPPPPGGSAPPSPLRVTVDGNGTRWASDGRTQAISIPSRIADADIEGYARPMFEQQIKNHANLNDTLSREPQR